MSEMNMEMYDFSSNEKLEKIVEYFSIGNNSMEHTDEIGHTDRGYCAFIE